MRKLKLILPLLGLTTALSGCWIEIGDNVESVETYYKDCNFTYAGDRLAMELQRHTFVKHKKYILYSQFNGYCSRKTDSSGKVTQNSIEAASDGSAQNEWFYTGKVAGGYGQREHVWPCASSATLWVHDKGAGSYYVDGTGYFGGGSDLYHVRTCNGPVNNFRGSSTFVDFDDPEFESIRDQVVTKGESGGKYELKGQGGKIPTEGNYANKCEPDDNMKGDVARVVLYVWLHYTDRGDSVLPSSGQATAEVGSKKYTKNYSELVGNLSLRSIMGYDTIERCKEKLLEWHTMDKPSAVEKLRNDTVQRIQGNRNPFVDHPELVAKVLK